MDPVRFGRALGIGARAAAKTVVRAVDAATSPNPSPQAPRGKQPPAAEPPRPRSPATAHIISPRAAQPSPGFKPARAAAQASSVASRIQPAARGVREGSRRFGREVWNPFVRLSGVLWLEVTGVFFGIFALFALGTAWRLRSAWHATAANAGEHQRLLGAILMLALFGYFCVSSFVRAKRRERRR